MTSKYAPTADELEFAAQSMPVQKIKNPTTTSKYAPTQEEMEFAQHSAQMPQEQEMSSFRSYLNAIGGGLVKGTAALGEMIGQTFLKEDPFGHESNRFGQSYGFDVTPEVAKLRKESQFKPIPEEEKEKLEEEVEERLPTKEGFVEDVLSRGAELAPTSLIGPGGLVGKGIRTAAAAVSGQGAKKAGFGETGQTIAEFLSFASPNLSRRLIGSNAEQQRLIDFGRAHGMTEEQLVPSVIENGWFRQRLARVANKGTRVQDRLEESRDAVNNIFETLRHSPEATQTMSPQNLRQIMGRYAHEWFEIEPHLRQRMEPAFRDFMNSRGTGRDFIRFYQHLNQGVPDPRRIGRFQEVTRQALEHISPEMGAEFRLANRLAHNRYNAAHMLRPPANPDPLPLIKGIGAVMGLLKGDWTIFKAAMSAIGAKHLATEFLLNPRLQNLSTKTVQALNSNKIELARQTFQKLREDLREESPEFYEETKDFDIGVLNPNSKS